MSGEAGSYLISPYSDDYCYRLEKFFCEVWTPPSMLKSKFWFDWIIKYNPHVSDVKPTLLLAHTNSKIIGMVILAPTVLLINGVKHQVAWGRDFYVAPEYRRLKVASKLNAKRMEYYGVTLSSGQSRAMRSLQNNQDWCVIGKVHQYEKMVMSLNVLKKSFKDGTLKLFKRAAAMVYAQLRVGIINLKKTGEFTVRHRQEFDPRVDSLWEACSLEYSRICSRDSKTLNWRFVKHPYFTYTISEAYGKDGTYKGYLVSRREGDICWLVDILTHKNDHASRAALIYEVEKHFTSSGVVKFICRSLCDPFERSLRSFGYISTTFEQYASFRANSIVSNVKPSQWYVTALDSDLDR